MGFLRETRAPEGLEGGNLASDFQHRWPFRALLAGLGCRKAILFHLCQDRHELL